ncbi:SgcJ/EcaC family oxidoreductase [Streptomyces sp. NBC_01537]|uniref:SgcJ/EcaC family oxidoreductase n=1 Tax=Streptomyces sp. NBC_01537 TaxID=2903896 RepID=UPI0038634FC2
MTRSHDEAAIEGVLEGVYKAWDAGDADAFAADHRDDATAILPGSYRRSKEDVRENMAAGFASFLKGSTSIIMRKHTLSAVGPA